MSLASIWVHLPVGPQNVRLTTLLAMAIGFAFVLLRTRSPIRAAIAVMAPIAGFEILYQATGSLLHGWSVSTLAWTTAGTLGWLVAARALGIQPDWRLLLGFGILWAGWTALGFGSNMPDRVIPGADVPFNWRDEVINVVGKSLLMAAYVLPASRAKLKDLDVRSDQLEVADVVVVASLKRDALRTGSDGRQELPTH